MRISDWSSDVCSSDLDCEPGWLDHWPVLYSGGWLWYCQYYVCVCQGAYQYHWYSEITGREELFCPFPVPGGIHCALPDWGGNWFIPCLSVDFDRKSTRLNSSH